MEKPRLFAEVGFFFGFEICRDPLESQSYPIRFIAWNVVNVELSSLQIIVWLCVVGSIVSEEVG